MFPLELFDSLWMVKCSKALFRFTTGAPRHDRTNSPERRCHLSKNKHFTELWWNVITLKREIKQYEQIRRFVWLCIKKNFSVPKKFNIFGVYWASHPEQWCVVHAPYFHQALAAAAVDSCFIGFHTQDRAQVLEIEVMLLCS